MQASHKNHIMTYVDKRDWPVYNEKIVCRGTFYIMPGFLDDWDNELQIMNSNKKGRPYKYPETFIQFTAIMYAFMHLPYRQLEGVLRALSTFMPALLAADYTTLWHRISKLNIPIPIPENDLIVAIDSTGIKVTNRGEWIRMKHNTKRKGWIKVHVAVDVESKKLVTLEITDERISDKEMAKPLLDGVNLEDVLGDGAYDTEDLFNFLKEKGISRPGIKIRKNAVVSDDPDSERANSVLDFKKWGYPYWRMAHQYGRRWAVEGFFSAIKRIFGESVRATSTEGMIKEVRRIFSFYNIILSV